MADPQTAVLNQLRNVQTRSGKSIAELHAVVAASGLTKHGEKRALLMERFRLGYGDANMVVLMMGKPLPALDRSAGPATAVVEGDPLDVIYAGAKTALRPLHDIVMRALESLGPFEIAPKKTYLSLRRNKQFAMLGPVTKDLIELGLNAKVLQPHPRLKTMPPGGMCQYSLRLGHAEEVDALLLGWVRLAYDAAG